MFNVISRGVIAPVSRPLSATIASSLSGKNSSVIVSCVEAFAWLTRSPMSAEGSRNRPMMSLMNLSTSGSLECTNLNYCVVGQTAHYCSPFPEKFRHVNHCPCRAVRLGLLLHFDLGPLTCGILSRK